MVLRRKFTVREGFAIFPWNHFTPGLCIDPPFVQSSSPDSSLSMFTTSYPSPSSRYFSSKAIHHASPLFAYCLVSVLLPHIPMPGKSLFTFYLAQRRNYFLPIFLPSPPTSPFFYLCPFLPNFSQGPISKMFLFNSSFVLF